MGESGSRSRLLCRRLKGHYIEVSISSHFLEMLNVPAMRICIEVVISRHYSPQSAVRRRADSSCLYRSSTIKCPIVNGCVVRWVKETLLEGSPRLFGFH